MTKEELNIKCATCEEKICHDGYNFCNEAMKENSFYKNKRLYKGIKPNKKLSYAELEEKISILLSCNSCPDNKGGLLCQKEYEDKCLAQKIQYIKELKKENTELKDKLNNLSKVAEVRLANWQKYEQENAELKEINEGYCKSRDRLVSIGLPTFMSCKETVNKLKEAKEIIKQFLNDYPVITKELLDKLEQFINEEE